MRICIDNVLPDLKASIHVVFSIPLLHVTAKSMGQEQKETNMQNQRKIINNLQKCRNANGILVLFRAFAIVSNASAHAVASLGGKLWLLSVRSVVPSPAKSLKGGQEFGLQNLGCLLVTSTCFLYMS